MTQEKIIETVKKLHAHSKSAEQIGSEEEAQAFATKVQELLMKYNLSMSDIEWEQEINLEATIVEWHWPKYSKLSTWNKVLAGMIANAHQCQTMFNDYYIWFCGLEQNAKVCKETMDYMAWAAYNISERAYTKKYNEYSKEGKTWRLKDYKKSFLLGFISRLRERYREYEEKIRSEFSSHSTALVRLSKSLQLAKDFVDKNAKKTVLNMSANNVGGYYDGKKKADEVNIEGPSLRQNN